VDLLTLTGGPSTAILSSSRIDARGLIVNPVTARVSEGRLNRSLPDSVVLTVGGPCHTYLLSFSVLCVNRRLRFGSLLPLKVAMPQYGAQRWPVTSRSSPVLLTSRRKRAQLSMLLDMKSRNLTISLSSVRSPPAGRASIAPCEAAVRKRDPLRKFNNGQ
jgi:hypothetical protein